MVLKVYINELEDFLMYIDSYRPTGERFYTVAETGEEFKVTAVVQSSRRRLILEATVKEEELDKVNSVLQERGFFYVDKIEMT